MVLTLVWTQLVLMAATAWRLTQLIVEDDFPPIRWARRRLVAGAPEWVGGLVSCSWCAGVWVAAVVVLGAEQVGNVPRPWFQFGFVAAAGTGAGRPRPAPPPPPTTYQRTRR